MIARHIGIVACSAEGAALCYRTARLYRIIRRLAGEERCDAAVLGCTEIPLLIRPKDRQDCPLPMLDSTRLLARAAWRRAVEVPS